MSTLTNTDRLVSRALKTARKSAGFRTAEAAAVHFGWPIARYRAHESGTRTASPIDLKSYAKGFGVAFGRLTRPEAERVDLEFSKVQAEIDSKAKSTSARLRCARILRGYPSALASAAAFEVKKPTYLKHENGQNRMRPDMIGYYASMLGVSQAWLMSAQLPSGLGRAIDQQIDAVTENPESYVALVQPKSPRPASSEEPLDLKPGRPPKRTFRIAEYLWSDIERNAGDIAVTLPHGLIVIPALTGEDVAPGTVIATVVDQSGSQLNQHLRVFVSTENIHESGDYLVLRGKRLVVFPLTSVQARKPGSDVVLGRVIGKIEPLTNIILH